MSTRPSRAGASAAVFALVVLLAACGGDDESAPTTSAAVETAAPAPVTAATTVTSDAVVSPSDTADLPVGTGDIPLPVGTGDIPLPVGTGDIPLPPVTADLPIPVSVTVGIDSSPTRIERVPLGSTVALSLTNPNDDDEFHLHGYDIGDGQVMPAGQTATFTFIADQAGSFEVESHETDAVLLVLEVV
jgi:hypothetical protein